MHGAVEPVNVVIEGDRAHLFGLGGSARPTAAAYTAPELLAGGAATRRTDVFGLACVLHEALTGLPPGDPAGGSALSPAMGAALARGLAPDPAARPASAVALMREVRLAMRAPMREDGPAVSAPATASAPTGAATRVKRAGLLAAMAIVAVNIWTGSPLLALWIGSRIQGDRGLSMGAVAAVIACMVITSLLLIRLLARLGAAHDRLTGVAPAGRRQQPWMRSLSGERASSERRRARVSALDVVLIGTVLVAACAFEVWFFFFSGASI